MLDNLTEQNHVGIILKIRHKQKHIRTLQTRHFQHNAFFKQSLDNSAFNVVLQGQTVGVR